MPTRIGQAAKRQLCVSMPVEVIERLEAVAEHEGIPVAAVVRRAAMRDLERGDPDTAATIR